ADGFICLARNRLVREKDLVDAVFSKPFSPVFREDGMARAISDPRDALAISAAPVSAPLAILVHAGIPRAQAIFPRVRRYDAGLLPAQWCGFEVIASSRPTFYLVWQKQPPLPALMRPSPHSIDAEDIELPNSSPLGRIRNQAVAQNV